MESPLLCFFKLHLDPVQVLDRLQYLFLDSCACYHKVPRLGSDLIHCPHVYVDDLFLFLPGFFLLFLDFDLLLSLHLFSILFLYDHDSLIKLVKEMSEFGVDFVDQIRKVGSCLIVDSLEEQHRGVVLLKVLHFAMRKLSL